MSFGWVPIWMLHSKLLQNSLVGVFCTRRSLTDPTRSFCLVCLVLDALRGSQVDEVCPLLPDLLLQHLQSFTLLLINQLVCMHVLMEAHIFHNRCTTRHRGTSVIGGGVLWNACSVAPNGYVWEHTTLFTDPQIQGRILVFMMLFTSLFTSWLIWCVLREGGREVVWNSISKPPNEQTWVLRLLLCHICCFMCCFLLFTCV